MLHIAIVEDHNKEAALLTEYINDYGRKNDKTFKIEYYDNALIFLENYKSVYDIIFMDIMMPQINGMEAAARLRKLDKAVTLIFVTNMAKYAVQGYEVDAMDFIVKPVAYSTFAMKFKKALTKIASNTGLNIVVSQKGEIIYLSSRQIVYIEISGHKVVYHLWDENVEGYGTLSELEKKLQAYSFLRCNSCYLINPQYISRVQGYTVIMTNGDELLISHPRKKIFLKQLADWLGEGKNICL